jgi:hypothetical protein
MQQNPLHLVNFDLAEPWKFSSAHTIFQITQWLAVLLAQHDVFPVNRFRSGEQNRSPF